MVHGQFQMEVIIPIPLEWGLWSEQGTCVSLFSRLECTWWRERSNFPSNKKLNKCCYSELSIHQSILKKCITVSTLIILRVSTFIILKCPYYGLWKVHILVLGVPNNRLTCMQGQKTLSFSYNMHLFLPYLLNDSQTIRSTINFSKPLLCWH